MFNLKQTTHLGYRIPVSINKLKHESRVCEDNCVPALNFIGGNAVLIGFE